MSQLNTEKRFLIIGNSGSGKSWLASTLADLWGIPHVKMDKLLGSDGSSDKRNIRQARQELRELVSRPEWIIEGAFGSLAEDCVQRATNVIWLDPAKKDCADRLSGRGPERSAPQGDPSFAELQIWAASYWDRKDDSSWHYHDRLFNDFTGDKHRLKTNMDIRDFLSTQVGQTVYRF